MSKTYVVAFRHVERDKKNPEDPQTPTRGGEITAYAMGMELRKEFNLIPTSCVSSPQPRAVRTASIFMAGVAGYDTVDIPEITTDNRLNDFSTDKRQVIKDALVICKSHCKLHGVEVEESIHMDPECSNALELKRDELMAVIDEKSSEIGVHLVGGLHGASIDAACMAYANKLNPGSVNGLGENGGLFDKVEGFVLEFTDGELTNLTQLRQPAYLKTLATVVK